MVVVNCGLEKEILQLEALITVVKYFASCVGSLLLRTERDTESLQQAQEESNCRHDSGGDSIGD